MPIYEYKCNDCDKVTEIFIKSYRIPDLGFLIIFLVHDFSPFNNCECFLAQMTQGLCQIIVEKYMDITY